MARTETKLNWRWRLLLQESAFTAAAFTAAMYLYYFVIWGVQDLMVGGLVRDYITSPAIHVEVVLVGGLLGVAIAVINRMTDRPALRRRPLFQVVLLHTVLYVVALAVVVAFVMAVYALFILPVDVLAELAVAMSPRYLVTALVWGIVAVAGINLLLELRRVLGPGNLWRLLVGRYRRPRGETRVFLFMDLKGSTRAAEALGHERYSEMIQECFQDLTPVVLRHRADVYQYVGDEVVLSWPGSRDGEAREASVRAFFDYQARLRARGQEYRRRFETVPEFRGGIAEGPVTVIEVGDVKRDIVFHGDVLNTASRLLELCKQRDEALMAEQTVGEAMIGTQGIEASWTGDARLRGKQLHVEACSLRRADQSPAFPSKGQDGRPADRSPALG